MYATVSASIMTREPSGRSTVTQPVSSVFASAGRSPLLRHCAKRFEIKLMVCSVPEVMRQRSM